MDQLCIQLLSRDLLQLPLPQPEIGNAKEYQRVG